MSCASTYLNTVAVASLDAHSEIRLARRIPPVFHFHNLEASDRPASTAWDVHSRGTPHSTPLILFSSQPQRLPPPLEVTSASDLSLSPNHVHEAWPLLDTGRAPELRSELRRHHPLICLIHCGA